MQSGKSKNQIHICKICFNEIKETSFHSIVNSSSICDKCLNSLNPYFKHFEIDGVKALSIYRYDDVVKKIIFQFKGCKDYELKDVFLSAFKFEILLKFHGYTIVPLPSSKESDMERGFNHVEEIFKVLNLPMKKVLFKKFKHKQSDGHFKDRVNVDKVIGIKNGETLTSKKILIVDDVCTTGSSIRCAIKLVKKYNPKDIKILVISKRDFTDEEVKTIGDSFNVLK